MCNDFIEVKQNFFGSKRKPILLLPVKIRSFLPAVHRGIGLE